ncbi:MAG: HD domain-containing protein [Candidatus Eisenbacteria bacterium]|nr:HD domain-containing protein [Candidatus Eisenbacteria bacterium]
MTPPPASRVRREAGARFRRCQSNLEKEATMSLPAGGASPRVFISRFHNLLENTSQLLHLHLEIWMDPAGPALSLAPPHACLRCSTHRHGCFTECQARRWRESQAAMRRGDIAYWECDHGLQLAALPIQTMDRSLGCLVAVDATPAGTVATPPILRTPHDPQGSPEDPVSSREPASGTGGVQSPAAETGAQHRRAPLQRKMAFLKDLAGLVSDQMFMFSEMSSMSSDLSTRHEELNMLYSVTGRLVQLEDLRNTLKFILDQARATVTADGGLLAVWDRKILETSVSTGGDRVTDPPLEKEWRKLAQALRATLTRSDSRHFLGAPWELAGSEPFLAHRGQILAVGFPEQGPLDGCLALARWSGARNYRGGDLRLLQALARQVGLTLANADLYDNLKDFLMATVKSLVSAIEAKDETTSGHSERVNILSMLLGKSLELDDPTLETLRWASILHDVGKIGMPEAILQKPGRLTPEEFEVVKEHPERGYRVLAPIRQLADASLGVRSHHEMVNGCGYPQGLTSPEIPVVARIIAVADTFDALTSNRPYRPARSITAAMQEIRRVKGSQLDADVVEVLEKLAPFLRENQIMLQVGRQAA